MSTRCRKPNLMTTISDGGDGIRRIYGIGNESKKLLHIRITCKRNLIYFTDRLIRLLYYLPMERMSLDVNKMTKDQLKQHILMLAMQLTQLEEENRKLKETIKDHQLYEEKLEHRIIEFEELLHGE